MTAKGVFCLVALFCLAVLLAIIIRRLFFHRLARFPGPRLAALSSLYKIYFQVVLGGELLNHLRDLHTNYGDVVRIAPNELHFSSYSAYLSIYSIHSSVTKEVKFYKCFGAENSAFGAIDPHVSRARRESLSSFFSRRATLGLESVIQRKVAKLVSCLILDGKPSDMFLAFRCTTMDIIASYCFSNWADCLDAKDFQDPLLLAIQGAVDLCWTLKYFPWTLGVLEKLPLPLAIRFCTRYQAYIDIRNLISDRIKSVQRNSEICDEKNTIYDHLLTQHDSPHDHSQQRLLDEGLSLLQAGSDTVGNTCTVGTFHVLNDQNIRKQLVKELHAAFPERDVPMSLATLEKLPYLTAVIKESLRLSHGLVSPLPRVVRSSNMDIGGHLVPAKTVIGMSVTFLHQDPNLFQQPDRFSPDRWLKHSHTLDRYLMPFSRGPRMCLGINLAWAELYLILGTIFRQLDMDVHETSSKDFDSFKDYFIPIHQGNHLHVIARRSCD